MNLGERIKYFRKLKGMTLEELSDGISSCSYLSQVENGIKNANQEYIEAIASKLGISYRIIMNDSKSDNEKRIIEIAEKYKREMVLTEEEKALLIFYIYETNSTEILFLLFGVLISYYTRNNLLSKAEDFLNLSVEILPQEIIEKHKDEQLYYYLASGNFFYLRQDFLNADSYYMKAERLLPDNELDRAVIYFNLSLTKQRILIDKRTSTFYSDKAYELYKLNGEEEKAYETLINKGVQLHLMDRFDESIECLSQARDFFAEKNNLAMISKIETNIGRVYQKKKEYDDAIKHLEESLIIKEQISDDKGKVYIYRSLIQIYFDTRKLDAIEELLEQSFNITEKQGLSYLEFELKELRANLYLLRREKQKYVKEMNHLIEACKENGHVVLVKTYSQKFASFLLEEGQYKKAAFLYKDALEIM